MENPFTTKVADHLVQFNLKRLMQNFNVNHHTKLSLAHQIFDTKITITLKTKK